ncbi:hypothetical protein AB0B66_07935 [Catellatospora sp. NPDC049111]|uniref:hypothetical protein n=1 Tax=Catellatospora sp. NPDC049111 TaxID=3155271 RepID=UPI0033E530B3
MAKRVSLPSWAVSMFGRDSAQALAEAIPVAIQAAVGRQMDIHAVSGLRTRHAFGGGWPVKYEELATHLEGIPGVQFVKPFGAHYTVVLIDDIVILPVEYAKDTVTPIDSPAARRKINKTARELARQFGPKPEHSQPTFDGLDLDHEQSEPVDLLRGLQPKGIVIVYYAAHERRGLLHIGWGQISVTDTDDVIWVNPQPLAVPTVTPLPGTYPILQVPSVATTPQRFDHAAMPIPVIKPRTPAESAEEGRRVQQPENQQRNNAQN